MNKSILSVTFLISLIIKCIGFKQLRIGGLYYNDNQEIAFRLAANKAATDYPDTYFKLIPHTRRIDHTNTLRVYRATCELLNQSIIGLFGPSSLYSSPYIQSVCDQRDMPHIETHFNPNLKRTNCVINLYPHPSTISKALVDLVKTWDWKVFTILYENERSFPRISQLLELNWSSKRVVGLKLLEGDISGNYRPTLVDLKVSGVRNFVLDCSIEILPVIFTQAQQVGLMNEQFSYIVTNLDMHTVDLNNFQYAGTNITGLRLINPEDINVITVAEAIQKIRKDNGKPVEALGNLAAWNLKVETALVYDSVLLFHETINYLHNFKSFYIESNNFTCENEPGSWTYGYTILNYMRRMSIRGLTGQVSFDREGFRTDFNLGIMELTAGGLIQVGVWNASDGFIMKRAVPETTHVTDERNLFNTTFTVIISLTPPYGMLTETTTQLQGNNRYEGFAIDILKDLSVMLGFNYTLIVQEDGSNGNLNKNTLQWDGIIREIIDGRAHLGITDLTITSEREAAVDFTMPFMNLGISILYKKPEPVPPSLFMFISPFSATVWIMLCVAYLLVSLALFIMGRISPSEWINPYPCVEEPEHLVNQFSIRNSLWFTVGSLMQQGSEIAPIGISTRATSGFWWFFTLIIVSSYTANLAAFLTVETLVTSFKNIEELARQKEIKYGAKKGGATANFFRDSDISVYNQVWQYMSTNPNDMTTDNDEGVAKVENGNYAFLMESSTIEYVVERHCSLAKVGGLLDDKGYGIAMKKNAPYRNALSQAILKLQETGRLTQLKIKWWKEKRGGGKCASKSKSSEVKPLNLRHVGGVFLVLFIGVIMGVIGVIIETTVSVYKKSKDSDSSIKRELKEELRFFLRFKQNTKMISFEENISENKLLR